MNNSELTKVWKELKLLRELMFRIGISVEALQRTLVDADPEFEEQRLSHEREASEMYSLMHQKELQKIDAAIQRLASP